MISLLNSRIYRVKRNQVGVGNINNTIQLGEVCFISLWERTTMYKKDFSLILYLSSLHHQPLLDIIAISITQMVTSRHRDVKKCRSIIIFSEC